MDPRGRHFRQRNRIYSAVLPLGRMDKGKVCGNERMSSMLRLRGRLFGFSFPTTYVCWDLIWTCSEVSCSRSVVL